MSARIHCPAKTVMQSGKGKTGQWVLEFERTAPSRVEPLMGYTSGGDMRAQVKLRFDSREEAVAYAEKNGIAYRVDEPHEPARRKVSYPDNFAFGRRTPWTH